MRRVTPDTVRTQLREYILGTYLFTDDATALGDDQSFQETRQIDSMGMMQLIQFIEQEFRIKVDELDLVPDKLDSVNRLVRLVLDKLGSVSADVGMPTLVHLLRAAAARYPHHEALVTQNARVSYERLWSNVVRAARGLSNRGVRRGDRVALLAEHTPESVALYYGILAAGAVVVPLDGHATPRELFQRITPTGARLIVADDRSRFRETVAARLAPEVETIPASAILETPIPDGEPLFLRVADPGDLAALVYTSGTTAEPKAAMLTHRNFVSNVSAVTEYLGLSAADRVLSVLPIFYVYGSSVMHTHLSVGATVLLGDMVFAQRTVEWMCQERVTGFSGVPWMFTTLLDRTSFPAKGGYLSSLRYFTQAGSRMAPAEIARVTAAFPHVDFFVMYGQTEATSRLTYLPPSELASRPSSVGRPVTNVRLEIRRPDGSVAGPGESGEVVVDGPNVMTGYWNAPDATAAAITVDERGRWLHTGDIGHVDADGYLYLEGRLSDIIKAWGHRVSPAEVEEVALLLPDVVEALAVGVPDDIVGEAIRLVVVRAPGSTITETDVLAHCRLHLSVYKHPKRVIFASALPYTANGKPQRRRLVDSAQAAS